VLSTAQERARRPDAATIAVLFVAFMVSLFPFKMTGNEENYFRLAHRHVAPQDFTEYNAVFDRSTHLFVFNQIAGHLVVWLGYGATFVLLRIVTAAVFAVASAYLFAALELPLSRGLVAFLIFMFLQSRVPGGEKVVIAAEGKAVSYALALLAVGLALNRRTWPILVCAVIGTYLHFLAGGFWALFSFLLVGRVQRSWKPVGMLLGAYVLAMSPLLWILVQQQLLATHIAGRVPNVNEIYTFFRSPHHVAPFTFGRGPTWVGRTVVLGAILCTPLYLLRRAAADPSALRARVAPFAWMLAILAPYLALALVVSWFDRHTGLLGKLYLFRPAPMAMLLAILAIAALLAEGKRRVAPLPPPFARRSLVTMAAVMLVLFLGAVYLAVNDPRDRYDGLIAAIRARTQPGDIVVLEPETDADPSLARRLERPTVVSRKYVPTNEVEIYRWYDLIQWRDQLFKTGCALDLLREVPVRYVAVVLRDTLATAQRCGEKIWSEGDQALIRVNRP
jgi:hypothetical protein